MRHSSLSTMSAPRRAAPWDLSLGEVLERAGTDWPDREAVVIGADRLRYRQLAEAARTVARRLARAGVSRGSHVALMARNSAEWVVSYFAIAMAGAVTVPVNPRFSPREIAYVLRKSRCELVLGSRGTRDLVRGLQHLGGDAPRLPLGVYEFTAGRDRFAELPAPDGVTKLPAAMPDDTAVIMFTSGSTAFPKGCVLRHFGLVRNAVLHDERLHLDMNDRWFGPTPFFHASGCVWGILSTAAVGATLVSCERFDAVESMSLLESEACTYQHGIDTIFVRQLEVARERKYALDRLTKATSTGPLSLLRRIRDELGIEFIMSKWGATEGYGNLSLCDLDDPLDKRLETHGRIYDEFEYRVADPETGITPLTDGEIGEIQVKGPAMESYFEDPEATRATILPEGWLRTGDLGKLEGSYLHYTGRLKDMLKIGGENVAAQEIEAVLVTHPGVRNVAIVGEVHAEWGESAVAFVEIAAGQAVTGAELAEHCRRHLAAIKVPRRFEFTEELPKTGSGKVDKKKLV